MRDPFKGQTERTDINFEEIGWGLTYVSINDNPFFVSISWGIRRATEILNVVKSRFGSERRDKFNFNGDLYGRNFATLKINSMTNKGRTYDRVSLSLVNEVGGLGGLYALVMLFFALVYAYFVSPFQELHLSAKFN